MNFYPPQKTLLLQNLTVISVVASLHVRKIKERGRKSFIQDINAVTGGVIKLETKKFSIGENMGNMALYRRIYIWSITRITNTVRTSVHGMA